MIYGIDTGFLVAAEVIEHPDHDAARVMLERLLGAGHRLALAPQVLSEFLHVVTDARRFTRPLDMGAAREIAQKWWTAREMEQVFPNQESTRLFLAWMGQHRLGRKRLLDTQLAATYRQAGITSILTANPGDFGIFDAFVCLTPRGEASLSEEG